MAVIATSQKHIDLLRKATSDDFPDRVNPNRAEVDFELYRDLWAEHFVEARPIYEWGKNKIIAFDHVGVTDKGFSLLETQSMSWWKSHRTWLVDKIVTFALGFLSACLVLWLKTKMGW